MLISYFGIGKSDSSHHQWWKSVENPSDFGFKSVDESKCLLTLRTNGGKSRHLPQFSRHHQDNYCIFSRNSPLKPSIFHLLLGETIPSHTAAGDASLRFTLEMSWPCTRLGFLGENVTLVMLPGNKSWRIGGYLVEVIQYFLPRLEVCDFFRMFWHSLKWRWIFC